MTNSGAERPRRSWDSHPGRVGDLEAAQRIYTESMAWLQKAGHISDIIGCASPWRISGLRRAVCARQCAPLSADCSLRRSRDALALRGAADMLVGMSELHREQDDLDAAAQHLQRSKDQGEHTGLPQNRYRWRAAMARLREAQGDLEGALDLLEEAERLYVGDFSPNVHPIAAMKARVWVDARQVGGSLRLGARARTVCPGRSELPARVRAYHPGQDAPGAGTRAIVQTAQCKRQSDCWSAY